MKNYQKLPIIFSHRTDSGMSVLFPGSDCQRHEYFILKYLPPALSR